MGIRWRLKEDKFHCAILASPSQDRTPGRENLEKL
jgi:hypothetical protein